MNIFSLHSHLLRGCAKKRVPKERKNPSPERQLWVRRDHTSRAPSGAKEKKGDEHVEYFYPIVCTCCFCYKGQNESDQTRIPKTNI